MTQRLLTRLACATALSTAIITSSAVPSFGTAAPGVVEALVKLAPGVDADVVARSVDAQVVESTIASRRVFTLRWTGADVGKDPIKETAKFADRLERLDSVVWAAGADQAEFDDDRFHAWPFAQPIAGAALQGNSGVFASLHRDEANRLATGRGVTIAVLDTGIDASHPLLGGFVVPGYDLVDDDNDPSEQRNRTDDDGDGITDRGFGHGTFVAGLVRQVAPNAKIMPIRVLDDEGRAHVAAVVEGIAYAVEQGASVINLSLGVQSKHDLPLLADAIGRARDAGVIVVAAAGNTGDEARRYPAAGKGVIGVGALGANGEELAAFSCRGKWVDVAAPGVGLVSSMPGGGYSQWGGSSMAAPIVSGQVALIIERFPGIKVDKIDRAVWASARKIGKPRGVERGSVDLLAGLI